MYEPKPPHEQEQHQRAPVQQEADRAFSQYILFRSHRSCHFWTTLPHSSQYIYEPKPPPANPYPIFNLSLPQIGQFLIGSSGLLCFVVMLYLTFPAGPQTSSSAPHTVAQ